MRLLILFLFTLASCTVPDKASSKVMRETRGLKKSPVTLTATQSGEGTDDKLVLRENNSFTYHSLLKGTQKLTFYAGTFTRTGDTLLLRFHNNHQDSLWTGKAVINEAKETVILISKNAYYNKRLYITQ